MRTLSAVAHLNFKIGRKKEKPTVAKAMVGGGGKLGTAFELFAGFKLDFIVRSNSLSKSVRKKLKIISATVELPDTEIIDQLLTKYICEYEKKNGEIKLK